MLHWDSPNASLVGLLDMNQLGNIFFFFLQLSEFTVTTLLRHHGPECWEGSTALPSRGNTETDRQRNGEDFWAKRKRRTGRDKGFLVFERGIAQNLQNL